MSNWYLTDDDCCQYMRNDGTNYELIQYVWLDTTTQDKANGFHEYCIVHAEVDMDNLYGEEIESYISAYGYTIEGLKKEYGIDGARDLIAECVLETDSLSDAYVIANADSVEEAEKFIKKFIKEEM